MKKDSKRKVYFFPKTKLGKYSFGIVIACFILMYSQYWFALATQNNNEVQTANQTLRPLIITVGLLTITGICIAGITSIVSIIKYKDRAISLFIAGLIGLFGWLFILGEFLFPH